MTAIVGVLNSRGIAFAAIYNTLDFEGIPWETMIKMFRDSLRKTSKPHLDDYVSLFWDYVKKL